MRLTMHREVVKSLTTGSRRESGLTSAVGRGFVVTCAALLIALPVAAQQAQETPPSGLPDTTQFPGTGERQERRGPGAPPTLPFVPVDPENLTPEERERLERFRENALPESATFTDFVAYWLTPRPYPKDSVVMIDEGHAHPHPAVPWVMEIVKEDEDNVWLRALPPENPDSPIHQEWLMYEQTQVEWLNWREYLPEQYFLDFQKEIVPPPFRDEVRFEEKKSSLPGNGRWRMNIEVADINGDGRLDLIAPPPRLGSVRHPVVFLGDGAGGFRPWTAARWSTSVSYDYGAVSVEDFDGDGHLDIALSVHFGRQYVLFGDGAGDFTESVRLPSPDPRRSSRAIAAGDLNGDRRPDLVFIAEIDYDKGTARPLDVPTTWVAMNMGERRFELKTDGFLRRPIADNLTIADVTGDTVPDVVVASNLSHWRALVFGNQGDTFQYLQHDGVLSAALHYDVATIDRGGEGRDIVAAFQQSHSVQGEAQARSGAIVYPVGEEGIVGRAEPLIMASSKLDPYYRVAVGDINGDGAEDFAISRRRGGIDVFLQTEPGAFELDTSPELEPSFGTVYELTIADVNGDGRGDLIGAFADWEGVPGGIRVWLSRDLQHNDQ